MSKSNYWRRTLKKYLDDLSARQPAPGGGSVAALTAALAAGLLCMVTNYTIGKKQYQAYETKLKNILEQLAKCRQRLLELVDLDVDSYELVSSLRKSPPSQYQEALKKAAEVPLEVCQHCLSLKGMAGFLASHGNKNLLSDVRVADELLIAAFASAQINVEINLDSIEDGAFIRNTNAQLKKWRSRLCRQNS